MLDVTDMAVSKVINGSPNVSTLERVADALGVEVSELFAPSRNVIRCPHCGGVIRFEK